MKSILNVLTGSLAVLLTACAMTPEQLAAQQAQQQQQQQALAASLAAQCDAEAATLMRQQAADPEFFTAKATAVAAKAYQQKISSPLFQSCYQLAWQNHLNQVRLHELQQQRTRTQMDYMFSTRSPWCSGFRHRYPFGHRCAW